MSNKKAFAEAHLLQQSALIELYVLDGSDQEGDVYYLVPSTDANSQPIVWQGQTYTPYPMQAKGFDLKSQGTVQRPEVAFSNIFGMFSALCATDDDLIGWKFIRKRTYKKFLDGESDADPTACFPDDIYYIDRKRSEDKNSAQFELASPLDVDDVALPRRKIISNLCQWRYRSTECSFALDTVVADDLNTLIPASPRNFEGVYNSATTYQLGDFVYIVTTGVRRYFWMQNLTDITGVHPTNSTFWIEDECSKQPRGCQLRFTGRGGGLPFGGFPAVQNLPF